MVNYYNQNKEIKHKLFKYMLMLFANKDLHLPHIKQYIPKALQDDIIKLKLYLATLKKIDQYHNQIIPASLSEPIKKKLWYEINVFINKQGQNERKQYMFFLYQSIKKMRKQTKNICFLSGRSRAVYRVFHLSRLKIREHAQYGRFVGFKKISW